MPKRASSEIRVPESDEDAKALKRRAGSRPRLNVHIDEGGPKTPDKPFDENDTHFGMPALIQTGCTAEELREFTIKALAHHDAKIREIQRQVQSDANLINRTNADMNEYSRKHEVAAVETKANQLDVSLQGLKTQLDEYSRKHEVAAVDTKANQLDASLQGLRTQLDTVMAGIDETMRRDQGYIDRIGKVEELFQQYTAHNFEQMERDLKALGETVRRVQTERHACVPCGPAVGAAAGHDCTRRATGAMPTTATPATAMGPSYSGACPFGDLLGLQGMTSKTAGKQGLLPAAPPGFPVGGGFPGGGGGDLPGAGGDGQSIKVGKPNDDEECPHCRHVTQLWRERAEVTNMGAVMGVKIESLAMAVQALSERGGGGNSSVAAGANTSPHGCHCLDVDGIHERLVAVEQHLKEAGDYVGRIAALELKTAAMAANQASGAGWRQASSAPAAAPGFLSGGIFNAAPDDAAPEGGTDAGGDVDMFYDNGPVTVGVISKLFDDKVAITNEYSYDGGDDGDHWLAKVRGYLVSKCTAMLPILKWAESLGDKVVTKELIETEERKNNWLADATVLQVGGALWGFLNITVKKEALTCFKGATMLNGLDAWRRISRHVRRGKNVRLDTLRKLVRNPTPIKRLEDVNVGIMRFENVINDYVAAGGTPPKPQEMKSDLLDSLPLEIRENLLWKSTRDEESFSAFVNFVNQTVYHVLYHRGRYAKLPVSTVDSDSKSAAKINEMEEMLGAMMKKYGVGARRDGGGQGPGGSLGRDRPVKCANCGSDKHNKFDCPKPKLPLDKRLCHTCGEAGHISANCKKKMATRPTRMVDDEEPQPEQFGCVMTEDDLKKAGFTTIRRNRGGGRPTPRVITINDFMPTKVENGFKELQTDDDDDDEQAGVPSASLPAREPLSVKQIKREKKKAWKAAHAEQQPQKNRRVATVVSREQVAVPTDEAMHAEAPQWAPSPVSVEREKKIRKEMERVEHEPNTICPLEYEEDEDEINTADDDDRKLVELALDSGAVANCASPEDMPGSVEVKVPTDRKVRNFVGAGGDRIKNYGESEVTLEQEEDFAAVNSKFQITDVMRPLHSVGEICDGKTVEEHEILFTSGEATVVPAGALSQFLGQVKQQAKYRRKGKGLYLARMYAKKPKSGPEKPKTAGFGRQGPKA